MVMNNYKKNKKIAIILSGGNGKRFWPISNNNIPEQFVSLIDNTTMFKKSIDLIAKIIEKDDIYLVINNKFKQLAVEQTDIIKEDNIFCEPLSRQTAPALGFALTLIDDNYDDDTIICVFPADQLIKNKEEYYYAIRTACDTAANLNALVTIGIKPDRAVTDFGYIQFSETKIDSITEELYNNGVRKSINFAEKPDIETAQRFLNSGDFLWNSGILIVKKDVLKTAFQKFLNYYYEKLQSVKKIRGTENFYTELENSYKIFNKVSIDYGILEHSENIYVVKSDFFWDDINSWKEIHRVEIKDALDNVLKGNVVAIDTTNSIAISNDKLVAIMGLDDVVVVNTDNSILVCKKNDADKIDKLVDFIKRSNIPGY